jgi:DNA-binding response OmpR family regulator
MEHPATAGAARRRNITLVDDDPAIQDAVRIILERAGFAVTGFTNGDPLLDGDFALPDLFILDKQLPGVDGLDICRHLKALDETKGVPVLILSASPHVEQLAAAAAADGFLEKPFRMKDLLDTVARLLPA